MFIHHVYPPYIPSYRTQETPLSSNEIANCVKDNLHLATIATVCGEQPTTVAQMEGHPQEVGTTLPRIPMLQLWTEFAASRLGAPPKTHTATTAPRTSSWNFHPLEYMHCTQPL